MLYSGRHDAKWATQTLLACPTAYVRASIHPECLSHVCEESSAPCLQVVIEKAGELPEQISKADHWQQVLDAVGKDQSGLWIGYFAYELGHILEPATLKINQQSITQEAKAASQETSKHAFPLFELYYCPDWLRQDTNTGQWQLHHASHQLPDWFQAMDASCDDSKKQCAKINLSCDLDLSKQQFTKIVKRGLAYVAAGDVYQVNLSHRLMANATEGNTPLSREVMMRLAEHSPAWYAGLIEAGGSDPQKPGDRFVASVSPELLLHKQADGLLTTRPIKGTRSDVEDQANLARSVKDTAELDMITDLMRNDLGRICDIGSVKVASKREIEQHPSIQHGVSTITGRLRPDIALTDMMRAIFPGGSVTGAPKIRAMQIIHELETGSRGPYCGSLCWFMNHEFSMSVGIRTIEGVRQDNLAWELAYRTGCGIVADSVPEDEYQESLIKTRPFMSLLNQ